MDIEIGYFVRTKNGEIHEVIDISYDHENSDYEFYKYYKYENDMGDFEEHIEKSSKNLMRIIEYGDLVKFSGLINCIDMRTNEKIDLLFTDTEFCNGWTDIGDKTYMIYDLVYLIPIEESDKIDWVLTHEKIKENSFSNCYKVVE